MSFWKLSLPAPRTLSLALFTSGLLVIGGISGCGTTADRETATETGGPLSDSELQTRIEANLDTDPALREADLDVDADASENRARLSGTTSTEALRTRAIELARGAHPGVTLEVMIDVEPPDVARSEWTEEHAKTASTRAKAAGDSVTDSLDDTWIHTKVVSKLIGDSDVSERKINVDVDKKVVTLRGTVSTEAEKAEAAKIARETEGVARVVNQLKVGAS